MKKEIILKRQKGITLITLVVTILIIIILSSVTINIALDDNGLLKQTELTKDTTKNLIASEDKKINELKQEYANIMTQDSESEVGYKVYYKVKDTNKELSPTKVVDGKKSWGYNN